MNIQERPIYQLDSNQLEWVLAQLLDKKFEELIDRINTPEIIHTRDEAADLLGVRPNTISSYIERGILTNKGVGRKVLISSKELDRILKKNHVSFKEVAYWPLHFLSNQKQKKDHPSEFQSTSTEWTELF